MGAGKVWCTLDDLGDRLSERLCKVSVGFLTVLAGLCGPAVAQDFSAGKTAAQLFASDCSACHKSPAGLAKGQSTGSLASFLREHYTTKPESASALAAYVAGAGPGNARVSPQAPITGAKPEEKPAPKPRPATTAVEPGEASAPASAARGRQAAGRSGGREAQFLRRGARRAEGYGAPRASRQQAGVLCELRHRRGGGRAGRRPSASRPTRRRKTPPPRPATRRRRMRRRDRVARRRRPSSRRLTGSSA